MKQANLTDYILLTLLSIIWASAFFNIKIATESFGPMTIAFLRVFFGSIPVLILCFYKKIVIEAFSKLLIALPILLKSNPIALNACHKCP